MGGRSGIQMEKTLGCRTVWGHYTESDEKVVTKNGEPEDFAVGGRGGHKIIFRKRYHANRRGSPLPLG